MAQEETRGVQKTLKPSGHDIPDYMSDGINLFFAGSGFTIKFLSEVGVKKQLISWVADTGEQLVDMREFKASGGECFVLLDSGAFTAWTKGAEICPEKYAQAIIEESDVVDYFTNLDVIPGRKGMRPQEISPKMRDDSAAKGLENLRLIANYLEKNGHGHLRRRMIPVYHQGESMDWLRKMVDDGYEYIGISPSNDYRTTQRMYWLDNVYDYLTSLSVMPMTHGYAVTSETLMEKYPWFSVDSFSWWMAASFGFIYTPYGKFTVSRDDRNLAKDDYLWGRKWKTRVSDVRAFVDSVGLDLDSLAEVKNYKDRARLNALYLLDYEKRYKYNPKPRQVTFGF